MQLRQPKNVIKVTQVFLQCIIHPPDVYIVPGFHLIGSYTPYWVILIGFTNIPHTRVVIVAGKGISS